MPKVVRFAMKYFWPVFTAVFLAGVGLAFALDSDNDGMSDAYELFFKLNPASGADASGNDDTDQLVNLQESFLWTNPKVPDTDCDGFADHADSNALSRAAIHWAHPDFTQGDTYNYTGPEWWLGAGLLGGEYSGGTSWLLSSNSTGAVYFDVDRSILTNNLMLDLLHQDNAGAVATVGLLDADGTVIAANVTGNLLSGSSLKVYRRVFIPMAGYPAATRIRLNVTTAENSYQLWTSLLYIDEDQDGLDAGQEAQLGTSDTSADSDQDGFTDYEETFVTQTNPAAADTDTDSDGLNDGEELTAGTDPLNPDTDGDGLPDGAEVYGSLYQMIPVTFIWMEAKADAERLGGHLAVITGDREQNMLFQCVGQQAFSNNHLWIGAENRDGVWPWTWVTGEIVAYTRWAPGHPVSSNGVAFYNKNFTRNGSGQLWAGGGPYSRFPYLLEFAAMLNPLDPDTDGDGLTDLAELRSGSNPALADSDSDGLSDSEEPALGTNPLRADTDNDGLSDSAERTAGLDPLNPDCDADGLPDGAEVYGTLYQPISGALTWMEAKADAELLGGHLAVITSQQEQDALFRCVGQQAFSNNHLWIGAEDLDSDGQWAWITGEAFDYTRWMVDHQNASNGAAFYSKNYTKTGKGQLWACSSKNSKFSYLLEITATLNPRNPDMDGDGIPDGEEVRAGSNPLKIDTDEDSLSDFDEIRVHGTSPAHADTDFDGLSDVEELAGPTDPCNPDCDADGILDGDELCGTLYIPVYEFLTWHEAKADAERRGGRLAVIDSEEKHQQVVRLIGTNTPPQFNYWLGATDEVQEGAWKWITGEPVNYNLFKEGEPDNGDAEPENQRNTDYLQYWRGVRGPWNDGKDTFCGPYLLEISATLNPLNSDSDSDGIADREEILRGMNPASTDSDADGLSDAYELANGLNPGLLDSDFDGLSDGDEITAGTNPLNPDSDNDGLLDGEEVSVTWSNPLGATDVMLHTSVPGAQTVERTVPHISVKYAEEGGDLIVDGGGPGISWQVTVTNAGIYRLALQMQPEGPTSLDPYRYLMEVRINGCDIGRNVALPGRGALAEAVLYTPWLTPGTYTVEYQFSPFMIWPVKMRIQTLELYSISGTDADGNGIPDWAQARMGVNVDTDKDGLSDWDELFIHGTGSLSADTDNDGLNDIDELALGTDALDADSDNDGISDGVEVNELNTSALNPEFDGTVTDWLTLPGIATNNAAGIWVAEGTELRSKSRRGFVEYNVNLPAQDMVRLKINATHLWEEVSCSPTLPVDTSYLQLYVDGLFVGSYPVVAADGTYVDVQAFLPVLPAGEHTVRLFWENTSGRLALKIRELKFQQLGGPDANNDGVKDWMQVSLFNSTSIDSPLQSVVSPICLEGKVRYPELATIEFQSAIGNPQSEIPQRGAGNRWFANVPLNETGKTAVTVSFQNGAFTRTVLPKWVAFNIMPGTQTNLTVRLGDSVKLTALPASWHGGQFTLTLNGVETRSPNCRPLIYNFPEAGTYVISGAYRKGKQTVTGQLTVTVVDWAFPVEPPACMVGTERPWTIDLPQDAVLEIDDSIQLSVLSSSLITNNLSRITASLLATQVNGEHVAVARLGPGGAIMDSTELNPFWVQNASDGYFWVVEKFEDSELWEVNSVVKNLPDTVDMQIKVIVGGVTLDDYTLERWLTLADYDALGEYKFRLFHPNGEEHSVCHTFKLYQDGVFLGVPGGRSE